MKYLLTLICLVVPGLAFSATYAVLTDSFEEEVVSAFAARQGRTNVQVVRQMCAAGMAPAKEQYRKIVVDERAGVFKQLSPADRTTVCQIFSQYGVPCPTEEP